MSEGGPPAKKARCNGARAWCFTWCNFPDDYQTHLLATTQIPGMKAWSWGEEECPTTGTPHIQGYLEVQFKVRWNWFHLPEQVHWTIARGARGHNSSYTQKDGKNVVFSPNMAPPEPLRIISTLRSWQQELETLIREEPDDRSIVWVWENTGGIGKSALVRRWCHLFGAQVCAGKASDMKYQLSELEKPTKIVIFDVPRSSLQYISYQGIEEVKNACFSSSKFKSGMVLFNHPHVVIFANEPPDRDRMSADRWRVAHVTADGELQWS